MRLFDPYLYNNVHVVILLVFTVYYFFNIQRRSAKKLLSRKKSNPWVFVYSFLFIIVVGLRPVSAAFGDTVPYANTFDYFSTFPEAVVSDHDTLFYYFMWLCSQVMTVHSFFLILEFLYVAPIIIACNRLLRKNADIGLVICLAAFSFFTYGTNGLRNGVSLSIVFLALSLIDGNTFQKVLCAVLSLAAISLHASAALPVTCMVVAYFIKKPDVMFVFWGFSILVSLVAGDSIANLFASFGFDDRISEYILVDVDENLFSHVGFRWDFLLYSAIPILLGWYVFFKKHVYDRTYRLILGTYIFANAFWIMVIRAEYSNRFAYLSWFLYPIVLSYPLLKLTIWPKTQGFKCALIMAGHFAFTFLMTFVI